MKRKHRLQIAVEGIRNCVGCWLATRRDLSWVLRADFPLHLTTEEPRTYVTSVITSDIHTQPKKERTLLLLLRINVFDGWMDGINVRKRR